MESTETKMERTQLQENKHVTGGQQIGPNDTSLTIADGGIYPESSDVVKSSVEFTGTVLRDISAVITGPFNQSHANHGEGQGLGLQFLPTAQDNGSLAPTPVPGITAVEIAGGIVVEVGGDSDDDMFTEDGFDDGVVVFEDISLDELQRIEREIPIENDEGTVDDQGRVNTEDHDENLEIATTEDQQPVATPSYADPTPNLNEIRNPTAAVQNQDTIIPGLGGHDIVPYFICGV